MGKSVLMKYTNLGGESSIRRYVDRKLNNLAKSRRTFDALFPLMFSERENTFFEWDESYEIRKMSYGEAYDKAEKRGAYLRSILGKDGSPVGIAMENSADFIIDFWAVLHAGHAPLLMNLRLGDETLEEALRDAGASAVISDGGSYSVPTIRSDLLHENAENAEQEETSAPFGDRFTIMSSGTSDHVKLCA